jgi:NAD(P)-dependent dehydrogenase (short-subunit alcohol dehydrogenase family)
VEENRRLAVVGATGGIGEACVRLATEEGWMVHPLDVRLDARCYGDSEHIASQLRVWLSAIEPGGLIHAAGVNRLSWVGQTKVGDFWETFSVNTWSFYEAINQAVYLGLPPMRVVVIGSDAGRVPMRCSSLYCASKAALSHMVRTMARELAPKGWRINCVAPGLVEGTTMTSDVYRQVMALRGWTEDELTSNMLSTIPDGRSATTSEVAALVTFLLGEASAHINGETISLTGGK